MSEFIARGRDLETKFKRIDAECTRRIQAEFPIQSQILMLSALVYEAAGVPAGAEISGVSSPDYQLAKNKTEAKRFLRFCLMHQAAAETLKSRISSSPEEFRTIDITGPAWWPKPKDFYNER